MPESGSPEDKLRRFLNNRKSIRKGQLRARLAHVISQGMMQSLGIDEGIQNLLSLVSQDTQCTIWIRATNPGVLEGFSLGKNVTGKTLHTKGKSSEYPPLKANLAFFSSLSKTVAQKPLAERDARFWTGLTNDQDGLLKVVLKEEPEVYGGWAYPSQLFIPKMIPAQLLKKA